MKFCAIVEHKSLIFLYALWGFLHKRVVTIYGDRLEKMPNFLRKHINFEKDDIGCHYGQWYRIQKEMVCQSSYLERLRLDSMGFLKAKCKIYRTNKVVNHYKQLLSDLEYRLRRDKFLSGYAQEQVVFIFPHFKAHIELAKDCLDAQRFKTSYFLSVGYAVLGSLLYWKKVFSVFTLRLVRRPMHKAAMIKKLAWGFDNKGFRDDLLVDHKTVFPEDVLFYSTGEEGKKWERLAIFQARENGYRVIEVGNEINTNRRGLQFIYFNFFCAIFLYPYALFTAPWLLFASTDFWVRASNSFKLYSFSEVSCHWSIGNWHDIVETVVANLCEIRMFMYHWSDNAQHYFYSPIFTVQNDLFLWGPIMEEYQFRRSLHDHCYLIGCFFINSVEKKSKVQILQSLGLKQDRSVVVFYDSPVSDNMRFPKTQCDDFLNMVKEFALNRKDVQVVLKPRTVNDGYVKFFNTSPVHLFDGRDVSLKDIVVAGDVHVGMGIVAPPVLALMLNRPVVFYDTAGNDNSPLAQYEGALVFRKKEQVLNRITAYLNKEIDAPEVPVIKEYNVPEVDSLEILRGYIKTGRVDARFQIY